MPDVITRLKVESSEYDAKIQRAARGLLDMEESCRKVGGTLSVLEKEDLDFVKALGSMETVSKSARGRISELSSAFTELSIQYKRLTDEEKKGDYGKALSSSLGQLKTRITDAKTQLNEVSMELGNAQKNALDFNSVLGELGGRFGINTNMMNLLTTGTIAYTAAIGAAAAAVVAATSAWANYNSEISKQQQVTTVTTGLTGVDADNMTAAARALSKTYGVDFREAINAANTFMAQFGKTGKESIQLLRDGMQGMIQGDGPKLLSMIQQFAPAFRDAGLSANELVAIIHNSEGGLFTDENMNAIVMGIKNIRLMTKATSDALAQVGIDGQAMTKKISDGSMSVFDALQQVSKAIEGTKAGSQEAGAVMQQVFGRQGTMQGMNLGKAIAELNTNLEETKIQTGEVGKAFAELQSANERLEQALQETFGVNGWEEMATSIKANLVSAMAEVLEITQKIRESWLGDLFRDITPVITNFVMSLKPALAVLNAIRSTILLIKPSDAGNGAAGAEFGAIGGLLDKANTGNEKEDNVVKDLDKPTNPTKPKTTKTEKTELQQNTDSITTLTKEYTRLADAAKTSTGTELTQIKARQTAIQGEIKTLQDRNTELKKLENEAKGMDLVPAGSMKQLTQELEELKKAQDLATNTAEYRQLAQQIDAVNARVKLLKGELSKGETAVFSITVDRADAEAYIQQFQQAGGEITYTIKTVQDEAEPLDVQEDEEVTVTAVVDDAQFEAWRTAMSEAGLDYRVTVTTEGKEAIQNDLPTDTTITYDVKAGSVEPLNIPQNSTVTVTAVMDKAQAENVVKSMPTDVQVKVNAVPGQVELPQLPKDTTITYNVKAGSVEQPNIPKDATVTVSTVLDKEAADDFIDSLPKSMDVTINGVVGDVEPLDVQEEEEVTVTAVVNDDDFEAWQRATAATNIDYTVSIKTENAEAVRNAIPQDAVITYDVQAGNVEQPNIPKDAVVTYDVKAGNVEQPTFPQGATITYDVKAGSVEPLTLPKDSVVTVTARMNQSEVEAFRNSLPESMDVTVNAVAGTVEQPTLPQDSTVTITAVVDAENFDAWQRATEASKLDYTVSIKTEGAEAVKNAIPKDAVITYTVKTGVVEPLTLPKDATVTVTARMNQSEVEAFRNSLPDSLDVTINGVVGEVEPLDIEDEEEVTVTAVVDSASFDAWKNATANAGIDYKVSIRAEGLESVADNLPKDSTVTYNVKAGTVEQFTIPKDETVTVTAVMNRGAADDFIQNLPKSMDVTINGVMGDVEPLDVQDDEEVTVRAVMDSSEFDIWRNATAASGIDYTVTVRAEGMENVQNAVSGIEPETVEMTITANTADAMQQVDAATRDISGREVVIKVGSTMPTMENLSAYTSKLKGAMQGINLGDDVFAGMQEKLADATALGNLLSTAIKNGVDVATTDLPNLIELLLGDGEVDDAKLQALTEQLQTKIGKMLKLDFDTGDLDEGEENDEKKADISKELGKMTSGMSQLTGGLKSLGIELPAGMDKLLGGFQGLISVLQGVSSILIAIQTLMTAKTFSLGLFGLSGGGVIKAASGTTVPGNFGYDAVPAMLTSGEVVLNQAEAGNIASMLTDRNRGQQQLTTRIEGEDIYIVLSNFLSQHGYGEILTSK